MKLDLKIATSLMFYLLLFMLIMCSSDKSDLYTLPESAKLDPNIVHDTLNRNDPVENTQSLCSDGKDNDGDGKIDCDDPDCKAFKLCDTTKPDKPEENTQARCSDGIDNDGDGKTDCDDPDCKAFIMCNNLTAACLPKNYVPKDTIFFDMTVYDYEDGCGSPGQAFGCDGGKPRPDSVSKGMVKDELGSDGLPQFNKNLWFNENIHDWWSPKGGGTVSTVQLPFVHKGKNVYRYSNYQFFPVGDNNFGFAGHIRRKFEYTREGSDQQNFYFAGDDDVFVFLNGHLVIDLGGIHNPEPDEFNLQEEADKFGIKSGDTVTFDLFIAERMRYGSSAVITINMPCLTVQ